MNLSTKQKQTQRQKTDLWLPRGAVVEGWIGSLRLDVNYYREKINNKVLLYSTGNYIQYSGINHNGKEYKKECIYMYN